MSVYEVLLLNMAPEILLLLSMQFLLLLILSGNTAFITFKKSHFLPPYALRGLMTLAASANLP